MGRFRCQNPDCTEDPHGRLIFDFEAAEPVCPKCHADGRLPEFSQRVLRLETIHYLTRDQSGPIVGLLGTRYRLACSPGKTLDGVRATGSPPDVNCRACRETPEWRAAYAGEEAVSAEHDLKVNIDLGNQTIARAV